VQEQALPHSTVGADSPAHVLVQAPAPQFIAAPTHAAASHAIEQLALPHMRLTSPQESTPSVQATEQAHSVGQTIVEASQASSPWQLSSQARSGGQVIVMLSHAVAAQSMRHTPVSQPPVQTVGQSEVGGGAGSATHSPLSSPHAPSSTATTMSLAPI
jgi:hypothetical protein